MTVDSLPGKKFKGTVSRTSRSQSYDTRTMRAEIDLPNPDGLLQDGMFGTVTIALDDTQSTFVIPSACLSATDDGKRFVYVVQDGVAHRREVNVNSDDGLNARISSGLGQGDKVVHKHGPGLSDGTPVTVIASDGDAGDGNQNDVCRTILESRVVERSPSRTRLKTGAWAMIGLIRLALNKPRAITVTMLGIVIVGGCA